MRLDAARSIGKRHIPSGDAGKRNATTMMVAGGMTTTAPSGNSLLSV